MGITAIHDMNSNWYANPDRALFLRVAARRLFIGRRPCLVASSGLDLLRPWFVAGNDEVQNLMNLEFGDFIKC
jgi:hypothetical protein